MGISGYTILVPNFEIVICFRYSTSKTIYIRPLQKQLNIDMEKEVVSKCM